MRGITKDEIQLLDHISRWGSDGYPIRRLKRGWTWGGFLSIEGPSKVFKTKREAIASFEEYHNLLLDALAGRI